MKFYRKYSDYLYSLGSYDNYIGAHFKVIRTFFIYLNRKFSIYTGDIHKEFYIRNEAVPIVVLDQHQLAFLKTDASFEASLPEYLIRTKDILIFGCYTGLRFSDLMHLQRKDLQATPDAIYLRVKSIKTSTETRIKLSDIALSILQKYKDKRFLLPQISNGRLNLNLKELCEKAGWTQEVGKIRERRGISKNLTKSGKKYRFCDLITTHTMRRTAITTLLTMGMPETMVRKLSGHSANSKEFYRYVEYAQHAIDSELDRINGVLKMQGLV